MPFTPESYPGRLHHFAKRLVAFEHCPAGSEGKGAEEIKNTILFLAGINEGLLYVAYPNILAKALPRNWRIVELVLSSSYTGWTTSSLQKDAEQVEKAVAYFSKPSQDCKVVLMGHSTGSQVIMEYLIGPWKQSSKVPRATLDRPCVNGAILQAGVSDREGMEFSSADLKASITLAKTWVQEGKADDILPRAATRNVYGSSPSARRWLSLVEPLGDDDYFSSDLSNSVLERTFGQIGNRGIPLLVLLSGEDEHMPKHIDKQLLLTRWSAAVKANGGDFNQRSGIIAGATHNLNKSSNTSVLDLCKRVLGFLEDIQQRSTTIVNQTEENL